VLRVFSEFILVYEFFCVVRSIENKIESPYFIFCEKRKSVEKKYHVLKKRRKKKKKVEIVLEIL
jgi:hypothetical protein